MEQHSQHRIAIHCQGITKSFGKDEAKVCALRGINLDIFQGELLMIAGPSGSGKTTLISILAAILDPDDGECIVLDRNLQQLSQKEQIQFRGETFGFVFQTFNLLPAISALENVMVPLLINGRSRQYAETRAREMLQWVGLSAQADRLPSQLSGGQQQRIAIARAMVHDPKIIFCDEPTSSLDHENGQHIMTVLRQLSRSAQRTILIVTHDRRIFEFADRIVHVDDGAITTIHKNTHHHEESP